MRKQKWLALLLAAGLAVSLAACGGGSGTSGAAGSAASGSSSSSSADSSQKYTMRIGTLTVEKEQNTATASDFADRISKATDGQVTVQVYPSAQLGTAAQMIEGMQNGTIEGALFPSDYLTSADPTVGFVSVPGFAANDIDSLLAVMNDLGGLDIINQYLTKAGLHVAGFLNTDQYTYLLTNKKVTSLKDCNGMKIWAPPSEYSSALLKGMGATSTFFDTSDVAVSVQQGTIDGCMASPALYAAQKLYETDKYCMGMVGRCGATCLVFSESFLQSLPEDLRQQVLDTAMESIKEFEYDYADKAAEANLKTLSDNGCEVYMSTDYPDLQSDLEKLYTDNLNLYLSKVSDGKDLYDQFQGLLKQYTDSAPSATATPAG